MQQLFKENFCSVQYTWKNISASIYSEHYSSCTADFSTALLLYFLIIFKEKEIYPTPGLWMHQNLTVHLSASKTPCSEMIAGSHSEIQAHFNPPGSRGSPQLGKTPNWGYGSSDKGWLVSLLNMSSRALSCAWNTAGSYLGRKEGMFFYSYVSVDILEGNWKMVAHSFYWAFLSNTFSLSCTSLTTPIHYVCNFVFLHEKANNLYWKILITL